MKRMIAEMPAGCFRTMAGTMALGFLLGVLAPPLRAQTNTPAVATNLPAWLTRPLSLADALNVALQQNGAILQAKNDLQASYGIVVQTRAIALPTVQATGNFTDTDPSFIDTFPSSGGSGSNRFTQAHENWNAGIRIVQSIYEGGRLSAGLRAAKLTKEQALLQYQTVVQDTLLITRIAYYDVLVAQQQIVVNEASVELLGRELDDQQRRYDAGTVPRFNVLRAQVAVANARPALIRARNNYRIAKNFLSNLLGYNLPRDIWEDIPLQLTDKLEAPPYHVDLPAAIQQALERRTELKALSKQEELQKENIVNAKAGYKPSLQAFAGYGWRNSQFTTDLSRDLNGWNVGAQLSWDLFDGMLTRGKVMQARALYDKSRTAFDDTARRIELEVRTAYSTFIEAQEVLDSQQKVQEEAEEALRLAKARADAGTGTQLDVLDAETSLTQARTTQVQALHDYAVARARLERAIGQDMIRTVPK
jgi:outer membrane protein